MACRMPQSGQRVQTHQREGRLTGLALIFALLATGCAGHATIHIVPLGAKKISMTRPLVVRVSPDECYFWVNDKHELCIGMRASTASLLSRHFEREFVLSLLLDGLPAGSARTYHLGRQAMRAKLRAGFSHTRAASLAGLAVVWNYGKGNLKGRFRLTAKQQSYSVLRGWHGDRMVLFVGEFTAVADQAAGEEIRIRTEENGMARGPIRPKPVQVQGIPLRQTNDDKQQERPSAGSTP